MTAQVLIGGTWTNSQSAGHFCAHNPATAAPLEAQYPISSWDDCDAALTAAAKAYVQLRRTPASQIADFLTDFANRIDLRSEEICALANIETGLPVSPRLADVELPRTSGQLRQAADAVRSASWCRPTIDTTTGIRSMFGSIGPVAVFGPNNFPLAFGSVSGGDFAAAIAAGNPVIAKANSSHPGTTQLLAEEAQRAADACQLPAGTVQMIYRTSHSDGERLVADPRLAAVGYTGSQSAGLKLKAAADAAGKPIYLELSSINPVVVLPGAITQRADAIVDEFATSCLMGAGQFCTSPGIALLWDNSESLALIDKLVARLNDANVGVLLSQSVATSLQGAVQTLVAAGAEVRCGGEAVDGDGYRFANTLMTVAAEQFLTATESFQTEAFGNAVLFVLVKDEAQAVAVIESLEGNLTGTIYSATGTEDEERYRAIEPSLRQRVGRLLNDKMPTGVAVSSAMNHGGPYPATGHPGFTAVGMPDSILRFSMLQCYDNVRTHRLPEYLRDDNPHGVQRRVDGVWTRESLQAVVS